MLRGTTLANRSGAVRNDIEKEVPQMKSLPRETAALALSLTCIVLNHPVFADTSFDFLFNVRSVSNDDQYFLNLAVSHYGYDRLSLEPIVPRLRDVETDLPVVLFLADQSGRPPAAAVDLRARGLSWAVIFTRLDLAPDVLFVGMSQDPGPPYGRAWGHWKRNRRNVRLSDSDITGLVQIQIGSRCSGLAPDEMARARGRGRAVSDLVADSQGRPYRKTHDRSRRHGHS